jgi:hypothetical protein
MRVSDLKDCKQQKKKEKTEFAVKKDSRLLMTKKAKKVF